MGMYTELILGCSLEKDTPNEVIETLKWLCGDLDDKPADSSLAYTLRQDMLFSCSSAYFGTHAHSSLKWCDTLNHWSISARANLKNYNEDIEIFLEWLRPYVNKGSGDIDIYAIVIYEEDTAPTIYYKD